MNAGVAQVRGEDTLGPRNYQLLAKFIYDYSGIKMPPNKVTMLEGRLRRRLRATGLATFNDYCDFLFKHGGLQNESIHLIDAVTTNKTDFFREPNHFNYLEQVVLPELKDRGIRRLRAWSAACSNGAEPYTMAMVMAEATQANSGSDFNILATDLSTDVLKTARAGIYPVEQLDPVPPHMMAKYVMQPKDKKRTNVRITPALRSKIGFGRLNFMDKTYPVGDPFHMIFCRNVLIYFDKKTQEHVLSQLCANLVPDGYLFIGHSESVTGLDLPVRQVANTIFKRI
ncbi:CheR family methyltransferase [Rhizobium sp. 18065]|uniref:CheR family methyltransferase n=1 Tax=Rhizobium sp. 18065 TaxID=2681411 RepID=UPI00135CBF54|nr:CheR family methyltransferase [Rhizobium sp. 18065]